MSKLNKQIISRFNIFCNLIQWTFVNKVSAASSAIGIVDNLDLWIIKETLQIFAPWTFCLCLAGHIHSVCRIILYRRISCKENINALSQFNIRTCRRRVFVTFSYKCFYFIFCCFTSCSTDSLRNNNNLNMFAFCFWRNGKTLICICRRAAAKCFCSVICNDIPADNRSITGIIYFA